MVKDNTEVPTHKKKSKTASKSNSAKRSDHKHDYERVVLSSFFGWEWGRRCKICGRIDSSPYNFSTSRKTDFLKPSALKRPGISNKDYLSESEIREKFPGVRVFTYDESVPHGWMTYKEKVDEAEKGTS